MGKVHIFIMDQTRFKILHFRYEAVLFVAMGEDDVDVFRKKLEKVTFEQYAQAFSRTRGIYVETEYKCHFSMVNRKSQSSSRPPNPQSKTDKHADCQAKFSVFVRSAPPTAPNAKNRDKITKFWKDGYNAEVRISALHNHQTIRFDILQRRRPLASVKEHIMEKLEQDRPCKVRKANLESVLCSPIDGKGDAPIIASDDGQMHPKRSTLYSWNATKRLEM